MPTRCSRGRNFPLDRPALTSTDILLAAGRNENIACDARRTLRSRRRGRQVPNNGGTIIFNLTGGDGGNLSTSSRRRRRR